MKLLIILAIWIFYNCYATSTGDAAVEAARNAQGALIKINDPAFHTSLLKLKYELEMMEKYGSDKLKKNATAAKTAFAKCKSDKSNGVFAKVNKELEDAYGAGITAIEDFAAGAGAKLVDADNWDLKTIATKFDNVDIVAFVKKLAADSQSQEKTAPTDWTTKVKAGKVNGFTNSLMNYFMQRFQETEKIVEARKAEVDIGLKNIENATKILKLVDNLFLKLKSVLIPLAKSVVTAEVDEATNTDLIAELNGGVAAAKTNITYYNTFTEKLSEALEASNESIGVAESVVIAMTPPDLTDIDPINVSEPLFPVAQEESKEEQEGVTEDDGKKEDGSGAEILYPVLFATCGAIATTIAFFL